MKSYELVNPRQLMETEKHPKIQLAVYSPQPQVVKTFLWKDFPLNRRSWATSPLTFLPCINIFNLFLIKKTNFAKKIAAVENARVVLQLLADLFSDHKKEETAASANKRFASNYIPSSLEALSR